MRDARPVTVYLLRQSQNCDSHAHAGGEPPAWLATDDRRRYRLMRSRKRRAEFAAGRLLLRHALRRQFGAASTDWRLIAPEGEPPRIDAGRAKLAPLVSIAHSGDLVACAVAEASRLGVDVECMRARKRDIAGLAAATLHPLELSGMAALPGAEREHYFLRAWTLKESLAKALGLGLALPLREFAFDGERLIAWPAAWDEQREPWRFASLPAGDGALLSLAWTAAGAGEAALTLQTLDCRELAEFATM